jgi:hypothetical protein
MLPNSPSKSPQRLILQNTKFQIDNKVMHFSEWTAKNIVYVKDLVRNDGSWLSLQEFSETYSITVNFFRILWLYKQHQKLLS